MKWQLAGGSASSLGAVDPWSRLDGRWVGSPVKRQPAVRLPYVIDTQIVGGTRNCHRVANIYPFGYQPNTVNM